MASDPVTRKGKAKIAPRAVRLAKPIHPAFGLPACISPKRMDDTTKAAASPPAAPKRGKFSPSAGLRIR